MNTKKLSFEQIQQKLFEFNEKRGWAKLPAQDLAKSIVIEAAELLELYQWDNLHTQAGKKHSSDQSQEDIESEVADIFMYLLNFCRETHIDILSATQKKMKINEKRFPPKDHN